MRRAATNHIERLRGWRVRTPHNDISGLVADLEKSLVRAQRAAAKVEASMPLALPVALRGRGHVKTIARGVITLAAKDAAAKYELEQWLRSGGETELLRACTVPAKRVRIVCG